MNKNVGIDDQPRLAYDDVMKPDLVEKVRRNRIRVAVAAYSYEFGFSPVMSDAEYDKLAQLVHKQRNIATGHHRLDRFFQRHFDPHTGLWIHRHPHKTRLSELCRMHY